MRDSLSEQLNRIEDKQNAMLAVLVDLLRKDQAMSAQLDALTAQVQKTTEIQQSAITLIEGLADQIEALKDDPVKLQALATELKAKSDLLAAAVTANTPAPPPPVPPPP